MTASPAIAASKYLRIATLLRQKMLSSCRQQRFGSAEFRHDLDGVANILDRCDIAPYRTCLVALRVVNLLVLTRAIELRHDLFHRQSVIRRRFGEQLAL